MSEMRASPKIGLFQPFIDGLLLVSGLWVGKLVGAGQHWFKTV
jgi:hypothetical protein